MYYVVVVTIMDGLVTVPRRKRYVPMLAGMLADLLVFAVLVLAADIARRTDGTLSLASYVALAFAYLTSLRLAWQFFFYLQTDLYYVLVTVLGCVDLQGAARRVLRDRLRRALRRPFSPDHRTSAHPRDLAVARWYSWLLLVGWTASIAILIASVIPATAHVVLTVGGRFTGSGPHSAAGLADSIAFVLLNLAQLAIVAVYRGAGATTAGRAPARRTLNLKPEARGIPMDRRITRHPQHYWVDAAGQSHRAAIIAGLPIPPPLLAVTSAHRRLRGPYTAAGTIMRALAADALERFPALVAAHEIEVRCVTPELRDRIPATLETLTSLAVPAERTRYYSRLRTLRIAHGLTEFLRDYATAIGERRSIVLDHVDRADQTDQELVSVLLRRLDPALLTLVVGTSGGGAASQDGLVAERLPDSLSGALARYAHRHDGGAPVRSPAAIDPGQAGKLAMASDCAEGIRRAAAYVRGDGVNDAPELESAYLQLAAAERGRLHDERAAELVAAGEFSLRLGAIPYHRERGTDPGGAGAQALREALDYCIDMGFYEAAVDFGQRGRALVNWQAQQDLWWTFTTKMTTSLAALGRPAEAEELFDEARTSSASAWVHMQAAYATAMLYTRHHEAERRDHDRALGWINEAIAIATLLPDVKDRAIQTVFNQNGLALVESHQGNHEDALRLVSEGLDRLDADLDPGEHRLHRSVLRYNRGQVYAGLGQLEEALADYTAVIAADPHYAEYHFDRAALLRRLGRDDEAMAEYETAMRLSPPFPELYYNRGDLRSAQGDLDGALADFGYVLEIDPGYVDAYINRVALLLAAGQPAAARHDLVTGLAVAPDDPHLLCLLARLELEDGHHDEARAAADAAVRAGAGVAEAWATRAAIAFEAGDPGTALADLTRALELAPDPAVLFNRAIAHQALGNWAPAEADFTRVLEAEPAEAEAWLRRAECRDRLGNADGASDDLRRAAAMAPGHRAAEVVAAGSAS